jgi:hypothetical protein
MLQSASIAAKISEEIIALSHMIKNSLESNLGSNHLE